MWKIRNQHRRSHLFKKLSMFRKKVVHVQSLSPALEKILASLLATIEDNLSRYQLVPLSVVVLGVISRIFSLLKQLENASTLEEDIGSPVCTEERLALSAQPISSLGGGKRKSRPHKKPKNGSTDEIDQIFGTLDSKVQ